MPKQKQLMKYLNTYDHFSHSYQTSLFTMENLSTAFMYYLGMLLISGFMFLGEIIFKEDVKQEFIFRPMGRFLRNIVSR